MKRNLIRPTVLFLAGGAWLFLLLALASFSHADPPSHHVYPHPPMQNLCGPAGAYVAYYLHFAVGPGVYPILFFSGIFMLLAVFKGELRDPWLRLTGLAVLCIAFAAMVQHFWPGGPGGFPEGQGGVIGIAAASFLQQHFNTVGTSLILAIAMLIGLLLTADDLVLRAPGLVGSTITTVSRSAPKINFNFPQLPRLPALPRFVTRDVSGRPQPHPGGAADADSDDEDDRRPTVIYKPTPDEEDTGEVEEIELEYDHDEPVSAADDAAYSDKADPGPSEPAIVPPPQDQAPPPKNDIIVRLPNMLKPRQVSPPPPPPKELGEYHLPNWDYLDDAEYGFAASQEQYVREKAAILEQAFREFGIQASVVEIDTGPVITMYEISMAPGTKVSQITSLSNDIARALAATSVRIVAPVPGKHTVGIEVPNAQKEKVRLKELMQLAPDAIRKMSIPLYLGKDASGEPLITDLTAMPHCLIAGTTGSGKSVCINTIIMSILYMQRPDKVKLILVDPKVVEMAPFKDIPHLMAPVINDSSKATSVLEWACEKMDERYEFLAEAGVRNLKGYNSLSREELIERFDPSTPEEEAKIPKKLPYIVIIIDELADLMMTSGKEVEGFIVRIAQKARAVGIHLILATQRPQATVVTGLIKSNMPSKIAFRVASKMDSRIVLDQNGAELLLGQGDMLFLPPGASKPIRSQGTFIDDKEIRDSVKLVKGLADAQYEPELVQIKAGGGIDEEAAGDELFDEAVRIVLQSKRGSVSLLQRRLTIGYSRASRLIEAMAAAGIVGDYKGSQAREALITVEEWDAMQAQVQSDAAEGMSV